MNYLIYSNIIILKMFCVYTNDNNITINLIDHLFSKDLARRDKHEVMFRRINTYLINNNIIQKNKNIIDLGAWVGDNSIPWAKNINGYVYAIDPSPENIRFITNTCEFNNILNVKCIQYAISDKNEILSTNDNINHCSFVYGNELNNGNYKQEAVSLDYLYKEKHIDNIGYIHLDVEGMEYRILKGSSNIIDKYNPVITFEQHLEIDDYDIILTYLNQKKYKVFLIDEILEGCRHDCRNSIAFHESIFSETLIKQINDHIGREILLQK